MLQLFGGQGMEEMGVNLQDMLAQIMPGRTQAAAGQGAARRGGLLAEEEAQKLVDMDEAVARGGPAGRADRHRLPRRDRQGRGPRGRGHGPDVSREGVQRDLLPIVEGSTVTTKYGPVRTDHMLFIAAGAFHVAKPSDLIPELQGRFPIRVELEPLDAGGLRAHPDRAGERADPPVRGAAARPRASRSTFTPDAVEAIAEIAAQVNQRTENIGARRLHTVMEKLLDELSFTRPT